MNLFSLWQKKLEPFVRPAQTADISAIARLHATGFARGWSDGEFSKLMAAPGVVCLVLLPQGATDAEPIGFVLARKSGKEAEIISIACDPGYRRKGVARELLRALIRILHEDRVKEVFLEVASRNDAAIRLYKSTGFSQVGERADYYSDKGAKDSALVMRLDLD